MHKLRWSFCFNTQVYNTPPLWSIGQKKCASNLWLHNGGETKSALL